MSVAELKELREDLYELKDLRRVAKRPASRQLLDPKIEEVAQLLEKLLAENKASQTADGAKEVPSKSYIVNLQTYSWDQSPKFTKLYVTIPGLSPSNSSQVSCNFESQAVTLLVKDLNSKTYKLVITNLAKPIAQERCHYKVKDEMVVVLLSKEREGVHWPAVTAEESKLKSKNKVEEPNAAADPSSNIMGLMKKMYDDGDDKMKQMLNKTWYETQAKSGGGAGSAGGLGGMGGFGGMPDMDL
uniref:Calcyclin-binding protein-like n=1 Tax=Hirondellea gigas TaxID=1518452 RepID=A0A2P2HXS1_9CRUS